MRYRNKILFFKNIYKSKRYIITSLSHAGRNAQGRLTTYTKKNKIKIKNAIYMTSAIFKFKFFFLR